MLGTGAVQIVGNTVYNHVGTNVYGIWVYNNAIATRNVVYDNSLGIYSNSGPITENRIYHNADAGIGVDGNAPIERNVIYSNRYGVRSPFAYGGSIVGNIIYANSDAAIFLGRAGYYSGLVTIVGNTLYQPSGDGLRINDSSRDVRLRNNIIW